MADLYQIDSHKLHLHPARVAQWQAADDWESAKKVYPIYAEISPVGQCNHRCTFCAVDYIGYKSRHIPADAMFRCLSDMAAHGVKSVMFAGEGEPLLYREFDRCVNWAKTEGLDVAVTTNATMLTEDLARRCLGNVTWLKASVNAGDRETYAKVHGTKAADFDRVITNLGRAAWLRKERGWKTTLGAQAVLLPENAGTLPALAAICRNIGLDYLVVKPYSQHPSSLATAERYGGMVYRDWEKSLADALAALSTDTFHVVFRGQTMARLDEPERPYSVCHSTPNFWAYVMADGGVYGCGAHLEDQRFRFGSITEQPFSEVWEGDRRRQCWELMKSFDISECRKNCRMEAPNRYLARLESPQGHDNFI
jgi:cyclic pyranopterin phosphate synthase